MVGPIPQIARKPADPEDLHVAITRDEFVRRRARSADQLLKLAFSAIGLCI